jgi:proton glutamate symport protein
MSLTAKVLLGLSAGFALGLAVPSLPALAWLPGAMEPLGTLFINGIRMTVVPLVVSSLIVGVAGVPDPRTVGRLGGRALLWWVGIVAAAATAGVLLLPAAFALLPIDAAATEALRAGTTAGDLAARAQAIPSFAQWLVALVPVNPVAAAAEGAMLPLIIFAVLFGVALTQVAAERRAALVRVLEAVQDASLTLVRWVLVLAPVGVFALAVPLASRMGLSAAGAVLGYMLLVSLLCVLFSVAVLYPIAVVVGRVPLRVFAKAILPAQAVAASSRSSLAALPAMIEGAQTTLGLSKEITGFLLPLSAATFRTGAGVGMTAGIVFVAALYGVDLSVTQLATIAVSTVLLSFSVPGVPAGSLIVMVPILLSVGLPVEGVAILIGVDTLPDMFRTTTNVTGTMAVATALGGRERRSGGASATPQAAASGNPAATPDSPQ